MTKEDINFTNSVVSTENKSRTVVVTVEDNDDLDDVDGQDEMLSRLQNKKAKRWNPL